LAIVIVVFTVLTKGRGQELHVVVEYFLQEDIACQVKEAMLEYTWSQLNDRFIDSFGHISGSYNTGYYRYIFVQ
jgi:Zn-dependent oligopeptidase